MSPHASYCYSHSAQATYSGDCTPPVQSRDWYAYSGFQNNLDGVRIPEHNTSASISHTGMYRACLCEYAYSVGSVIDYLRLAIYASGHGFVLHQDIVRPV